MRSTLSLTREDYTGLENKKVLFAFDEGRLSRGNSINHEDSKAINTNDFYFEELVSGRYRRSDRGFKQNEFFQQFLTTVSLEYKLF